MKLEELIEELDQRYGNPYAWKECGLIQQAVVELKKYQSLLADKKEKDESSPRHRNKQSAQ